MTELEKIQAMLTGRTEKDIIAEATGVSTGGQPNLYNPSNGQFDVDPDADPMNHIAGLEEDGGPLAGTGPEMMGPPMPDAYSKHPETTTPEAIKFQRIANTYKPPTYTEQGTERHLPQQYGQMGTPYTDDEGPRTPSETYEELDKIAALPGGLKKHQDQHVLGGGLNRQRILDRQAAYNKYVAASRLERDEQRADQQARAYANRENIADRESRTASRMAALNPGYYGAGASSADGAPEVIRKGGLTFVSPRFRPLGADEAAKVNLQNAEADLLRGRPQMEKDAAEIKRQVEMEKLRFLGRRQLFDEETERTKLKQKDRDLERLQKVAEWNKAFKERDLTLTKEMQDSIAQTRAGGLKLSQNKFVRELLDRMNQGIKIIKMKEAAAENQGGFFSKKGSRDQLFDPETQQLVDEIAEGDFDEKLSMVKGIANLLNETGYESDDEELHGFYDKYFPRTKVSGFE